MSLESVGLEEKIVPRTLSSNGRADSLKQCDLSENGRKIKQEFNPSVCWSCLFEGDLKDIHQTYFYNEKPEVYAELLSYCFSIQVEEDGKQYFMCETCIMRLRDAANFRTQIEVTRNTFNSILEQKPLVFKVVEGSVSISTVEEEDNDDNIEMGEEEWLEDIKPLVQLKIKKDKKKTKSKKVKTKPSKKIKRSPKVALIDSIKLENDENVEVETKKSRLSGNTPRRKSKIQKGEILKKGKRDYKKYKEPLPYTLEKTDLECKICGEVFPVHKGLQMHMPIHFPNHICEQCGRWFATRTQLKTHVVSHTTEREACPICPNRVFKATGGLKAHMRTHAGDKFHYKCVTCDERFPSYNARRRHRVAVHGEENKKYACKHCPKRFCLQSHLSVHVRSIHLQERSHTCSECDASFFSKRGLRFHMLKHTGEQDYQCEICKKKFGRKFTLKEHMKIHLGVKDYTCNVCGKAFTQKCTLKGHMVMHDKQKGQNEFNDFTS